MSDAYHGDGTISNEYTAWCALCAEWKQCPGPRKIDAIRDFKRVGWRRTRAHGWLCPACAKEKT